MTLSIIIRAYNEARHIGKLLSGIHQQKLAGIDGIEIILVDSGSTDRTREIAISKGAKIVRIKKKDFSFGRALNYGCEVASGRILLFASAHVYPVYNDWLEKIVAPFKNIEVALVYGQQVGNEKTKFSEHQVFKKWFPAESNYNQQTPFCNNANCAIRKSLWDELPYDEQITGLEDMDWANKILDKGYKIVYESEATVVHVHEETPSSIRNRYQREAIAMKKILPKMKFNKLHYYQLMLSNIFSDFAEAFRMRVFFKEWRDIVMFRKNQFYGAYLGYNQKGNVTQDLKNRFYYSNPLRDSNRTKKLTVREKINYEDL